MKNKFLICVLFIIFFVGFTLSPIQAREGGDLSIAIGSDPESLDPANAESSPAAMVMIHSIENLFDMTPEGEIVPELAKDYNISEDGKEFKIYLREGIEFHDGEYFDAEAVKFNLERLLDEVSPFAFLIDQITEIEIIDDYTVKIHTDEPFAPLITNLSSHGFMGMVSPQAVEKYGEDFSTNPVGTGPFEFVDWTRGEEIVLERNEDYWGDNAYLEKVSFKIIPEDSSRVVQVETGEVDAAMFIPPRERNRLLEVEDINIIEESSLRTIYTGLNTKVEPLDDVKVRQALNYAINNQAIVEEIMEGAGRPSDAPVAPGTFGYAEQDRYDYNPEKAQELLAEAGYEDGFETTLHHPVGRYMMDETIAEAIQGQLAEIGIEVSLETMEWVTYLEFLSEPPEESEHEMYILGWGNMTGDSDNGLYPLFHSSEWAPKGFDYTYLGNERVDELLDQARVTPQPERREEIYEEAIEIIWEEAPWIFLHSEVQINAVREGVEGLLHHPREYIFAGEAYLEDN